MTSTLCQTFQRLANETWEHIEAAEQVGMAWSEETNTEALLLELCRKHSNEVLVSAFTKRREASIGADWEWWFVGTSAYGMRVQAKRISLPKETFGHLRYRAKWSTQDQMTTLIRMVRLHHLTPAYCFYVASRAYPRDLKWPKVVSPPPSKPTGCLIGHAEYIRSIASNRLYDLAPGFDAMASARLLGYR